MKIEIEVSSVEDRRTMAAILVANGYTVRLAKIKDPNTKRSKTVLQAWKDAENKAYNTTCSKTIFQEWEDRWDKKLIGEGDKKMKVKDGKIVKATESELFSYYLMIGWDKFMPFPEYVMRIKKRGCEVVAEENKKPKGKGDKKNERTRNA